MEQQNETQDAMTLYEGRPADVIERFLPSTGHDFRTVHLVGED